jgi:hypothetical protein
VGVQYSSDGATPTATTVLSILLGAEVEVANGVVLDATLVPYSTADMGGTTDSTMNTGTGNLTQRAATLSFLVYLN